MSAFAPLFRNRSFVFFWLADMLGWFGHQLYIIGVIATVAERTGSALQTVGVTVALTTPSFLLGAIAGPLIDRYPRRRVLVGPHVLRAILVGTLVCFIQPETFTLWAVYPLVFLMAATGVFYRPAFSATTPSLVESQLLVRANSLIMTTNQAMIASSYLVLAVVVLRYGLFSLAVLTVMAYSLAALCMLAMRTEPPRPTQEQPSQPPLLTSFRAGLGYIRRHPVARALVVMEAIEYWPHGLWTSGLMITFTREALGGGTADWSSQGAAYFAGQWVGSAIALFLAARLAHRPGFVIIGNAFIFAFLTLAYSASPTVLIAVILCFAFGPSSAIRDVTQDSLLQSNVAPDMIGRVYATREMLGNFFFTIAGLGFAALADFTDVRYVYALGGTIYLMCACYAALSHAIRNSRMGQVREVTA